MGALGLIAALAFDGKALLPYHIAQAWWIFGSFLLYQTQSNFTVPGGIAVNHALGLKHQECLHIFASLKPSCFAFTDEQTSNIEDVSEYNLQWASWLIFNQSSIEVGTIS
jgi:hypothetical protein